MNQRRVSWFMCVLSLLVLSAGIVSAQEEVAQTGLEASLDVAYNSKYVWRGTVVNDESVLQPSLTLSWPSGISFNWWGNLDLTDFAGESGNFTEIDYTLNYTWDSSKTSWNTGVIAYTFPSAADTTEVYLSACLGGTLSPTFAVNYDFDEAEGFYASLSAAYCCTLPSHKESPMALGLSGRIGYGSSGYNNFYFGSDESGIVDLLLSASLPIPAGELTITPAVNYSKILDSDLKRSYESATGLDADNFWFGLSISMPL